MTKITKVAGMTFISDKNARVTIGFVKMNRMIEVAISYCAPADKFKRKIGRQNVENNYCEAKTITLPLGKNTEEYIVDQLRDMFCYLN